MKVSGFDASAASMGPRPNGRGWHTFKREGQRERLRASMGPRPNGRGWVGDGSSGPSTSLRLLQWGRDLTDADGHHGLARLDHHRVASMGPRPNGRGWHVSVVRTSRIGPASMGPRPNGRGWVATARLLAAKTVTLQWGRDLTDADGRVRTSRTCSACACFNGAAT